MGHFVSQCNGSIRRLIDLFLYIEILHLDFVWVILLQLWSIERLTI